MPYGRTPKGGAKNSVAAKIARGQSKPAMPKKKTQKKKDDKGFLSGIKSSVGSKIQKKKKSLDRKLSKLKKVKGMF